VPPRNFLKLAMLFLMVLRDGECFMAPRDMDFFIADGDCFCCCRFERYNSAALGEAPVSFISMPTRFDESIEGGFCCCLLPLFFRFSRESEKFPAIPHDSFLLPLGSFFLRMPPTLEDRCRLPGMLLLLPGELLEWVFAAHDSFFLRLLLAGSVKFLRIRNEVLLWLLLDFLRIVLGGVEPPTEVVVQLLSLLVLDFLRSAPETEPDLVVEDSGCGSSLSPAAAAAAAAAAALLLVLERRMDFFLRVEEEDKFWLLVFPKEDDSSSRLQWLFSGDRNRMDGISSSRLGSARHDSPAGTWLKDFTFLLKSGDGADFLPFLDAVYRFSSPAE